MKLIYFFIISLIIFTNSYSQEEGKTAAGVELPDFVITGKDVVKIKKTDKQTPLMISTLSENFILPTYTTEEIPVKDIPLPVREDLKLIGSNEFFKGYIKGSLGFYSLPDIEAIYSSPINNGVIKGRFNGFYNRPHAENTDNYKLSFGGDVLYWTDINSSFLPGTQFKGDVNLSTNGYKFYGSNLPTEKRTVNNLNASLSIANEYKPSFLFNINLDDEITSLSGEKFKENVLNLKFNSLFRVSFFNIGISSHFKYVTISNDSSSHPEPSFLILRPKAGFKFTSLVSGSFGFTISQTALDKFIMPYAELAVKLAPNVTFLGEFNPNTELMNPAALLRENPFISVNNLSSFSVKRNISYNLEAKYEFQRLFEIRGGFKYFSSDSLPYFLELQKGRYSIGFSDIKSMTPFFVFNLLPSDYGYLFSLIEINASQNDTGQTVPYKPSLSVSADYGYTFNSVLTTSLHLRYLKGYYTDLANTNKINNYINLGISIAYNFDKRFDFFVKLENILNNKNYRWNNYLEKPFDLFLGVKYKL
jgi:hypothetical protein